MTRPLLIALTFDVEEDAFDDSILPDANSSQHEHFRSRGISQGVPMLKAHLASILDSFEQPACATWFLRCDDQIEALTGRPDFILSRYAHLWEQFLETGDEVGLHAHLYNSVQGQWQQTVDADSHCNQLQRTHQIFTDAGFDVHTSRIGESYFSVAILQQLETLGIKADSTAMPGRVRVDEKRTIDWGPTPHAVYEPDTQDHRVSRNKAHSESLLQIPFSMVTTLADYDSKPLTRYLDLSFHERAFQPGLEDAVQHAELLVTVTHPSTVLSELGVTGHGLLSFSMQAFSNNLDSILAACRKRDRAFRFVTLRQAVEEGLIAPGTRTGCGGPPPKLERYSA